MAKVSKNFTIMSNQHLQEKGMSLKAKGLLSQMISLPDNWKFSMKGLAAINKENIGTITSAINELRDFGYLKIDKVLPNELNNGRIEYIYTITKPSEKPLKNKI